MLIKLHNQVINLAHLVKTVRYGAGANPNVDTEHAGKVSVVVCLTNKADITFIGEEAEAAWAVLSDEAINAIAVWDTAQQKARAEAALREEDAAHHADLPLATEIVSPDLLMIDTPAV